jgi:hypothetical protein
MVFTCTGVRSKEMRASVSLLCTQTQEKPLPIHAVDPDTTSAGKEKAHRRQPLPCSSKRKGGGPERTHAPTTYPLMGGVRRGGGRRGRSRHSGPCGALPALSVSVSVSGLVPGAPLPLRLRCLATRRDQRGIPMASDPGGREIPRGGGADHGGKVAPRGLAPRPRSSLISRPFDWQLALALLPWLLAADADRGGALPPPAYVSLCLVGDR